MPTCSNMPREASLSKGWSSEAWSCSRMVTRSAMPNRSAFARAKAERFGIADRVTILLQDHASLDQPFDKLASLGMFEHVGIDHHRTYFAAVARLLEPGGLYLHHAISRPAKGTDRGFRRMRAE